jgi:hypothetical protein
MKISLTAIVFILSSVVAFPVLANSTLFTLVTLFEYPADSGNYVQVQNQNQMTRNKCETQIFLLGDYKELSLPFGRGNKWEIIGGEAKLQDGEIVIVSSEKNNSDISFLCVPTGWSTKADS